MCSREVHEPVFNTCQYRNEMINCPRVEGWYRICALKQQSTLLQQGTYGMWINTYMRYRASYSYSLAKESTSYGDYPISRPPKGSSAHSNPFQASITGPVSFAKLTYLTSRIIRMDSLNDIKTENSIIRINAMPVPVGGACIGSRVVDPDNRAVELELVPKSELCMPTRQQDRWNYAAVLFRSVPRWGVSLQWHSMSAPHLQSPLIHITIIRNASDVHR
jgi:hypothetical protein